VVISPSVGAQITSTSIGRLGRCPRGSLFQ
jgi:hypothetical protein